MKRYHTKSIAKALYFRNQKNEFEKSDNWKIAAKVSNRIIIDVDTSDITNILLICHYYEAVLGYKFNVIKTHGGFHLISVKKYVDKKDWRYDICRVLYPILAEEDVIEYIQKIHDWYKLQCTSQRIEQKPKKEFLEQIPIRFALSGLDHHVGNFDILFALKVIYNDYYCIRITKKSKKDIPITINTSEINKILR